MKNLFKKCVVAILTFEAKWLLKRAQPKIIAITGSVGKTSTKDAIYAVIKNKVHARKSEKSFNSDIGVPLTVLGLE
jgi:UDP-N-acetylmuramoyl-tripeptide--D-alanyl-D-alanine ligase